MKKDKENYVILSVFSNSFVNFVFFVVSFCYGLPAAARRTFVQIAFGALDGIRLAALFGPLDLTALGTEAFSGNLRAFFHTTARDSLSFFHGAARGSSSLFHTTARSRNQSCRGCQGGNRQDNGEY